MYLIIANIKRKTSAAQKKYFTCETVTNTLEKIHEFASHALRDKTLANSSLGFDFLMVGPHRTDLSKGSAQGDVPPDQGDTARRTHRGLGTVGRAGNSRTLFPSRIRAITRFDRRRISGSRTRCTNQPAQPNEISHTINSPCTTMQGIYLGMLIRLSVGAGEIFLGRR